MNFSNFKLRSVITLFFCILLLGACNDDEGKDELAPDALPPTISSFTPDTGLAGDTIAISGTNFSTTKTENVVKLNGTVAAVIAASADSLTITVPEEATTGKITVTIGELVATSTKDFTILPPLKIGGFSPASGVAGDTITITGEHFSATASENMVKIGGTVAPVTSATTVELKVTVPEEAATGSISVTAHRQTVTTGETVFTVINSPVISNFSPSKGVVGDTVLITGENFSTELTGNTVKIGDVATTVIEATATQLSAIVPEGATTGSINVTVNGQTATTGEGVFRVLYTPVISSFSPESGPVGTILTITGEHFSTVLEENVVKIGSGTGTIASATTTKLTVTVAEGATTGYVNVAVNGLNAVALERHFRVADPPVITGFSPASGEAGTIVTITGENFSIIESQNKVRIGSTLAHIKNSTSTELTIVVPEGATTGKVTVSVVGQEVTSTDDFIVIHPPVITSFSPESGIAGDEVTIIGENFSATAGENTVTFNGVTATVTAASAASLTVLVPQGVSTGKIQVTVGDKTAESTKNFTVVPPPVITGFSPASGAVGTKVAITGENFSAWKSKNTVEFNGVTALVDAASATSLTVVVPAGASTGQLTVTVNDQTAVSAEDFTVLSIKQIAIGFYHTLILKSDNTLWATGSNGAGTLGDGTYTSTSTPKQVMEGVKAVAAGEYHTMILKEDNTLWTTGANFFGEIGDGTTDKINTPKQIMEGVKAVVAGYRSSLILKEDNTLWATGNNGHGQLGDGTTTNVLTPKQIMESVKTIAGGGSHTMILKTDNTLWAMGNNEHGQLGDGTTTSTSTPKQIMEGIKSIAAGGSYTLILKSDNTLWATGDNSLGQLGDGTTTSVSTPKQIMAGVKAVSAGYRHSLILKEDNTLWATGSNNYGQLGDGTTTDIHTPKQVMDGVNTMAAGGYHSLILKEDQSLWGIGYNWYGQLGNGTKTDTSTPVQVGF